MVFEKVISGEPDNGLRPGSKMSAVATRSQTRDENATVCANVLIKSFTFFPKIFFS